MEFLFILDLGAKGKTGQERWKWKGKIAGIKGQKCRSLEDR